MKDNWTPVCSNGSERGRWSGPFGWECIIQYNKTSCDLYTQSPSLGENDSLFSASRCMRVCMSVFTQPEDVNRSSVGKRGKY